MDFAEHLEQTRRTDGTYDLAAAAEARAREIADDLAENAESRQEVADKAAQTERRNWESRNRDELKKVFGQDALPDLDLEARVPLGGDIVHELGSMRLTEIRLRKDLRTKKHLDENDAFGREMSFWYRIEALLPDGAFVADIVLRP